MASLNLTFQPTYVKNKAPVLNEHGAQVAINAQGCCPSHPDILLREKNLFGRIKSLHRECPRCKIARESSLQFASATTSVMKARKSSNVESYIPDGDETFEPYGSGGGSVPVVNVHGFPHAFDNNGRCIYHDEIQLRKPTWFGLGEMTELRKECPECKATWRWELDLKLRIQSCFED